MAEELWRRSARDVVALLGAREISPSELVEIALSRIEAVDGAVNAVPTRCPERALAHARQIESAGPPEMPGPGYLHGLPIVVKDLTDVAGVRTTRGSPIFADRVPERSDILVERLEANGAIVVGKSNTPEFGAGAQTFNEVFGATRNPWNTAKTCGGSSGGAAVALATGEAWLATGNDLGGSLRIPGSFCSVIGLRTSPGRVARGPAPNPFERLGNDGPMARDVRDAALMLDAQTGENGLDPLSLPAPAVSFQEAVERLASPARIAWSPDLGIAPVEPEVRDICATAATWFENLGATLEPACPDLSEAREAFQVLRAHAYVLAREELLQHHRDKLKPEVVWNIEKGLGQDGPTVARAERARGVLYHRVADFFQTYDLLCCPAVMAPPFDIETRYLETVAGVAFDNYVDWMMLTYAITLTECPALSIPCGFTAAGLPVGLQLVAPHRGEAALLAAAARFEDGHDFAAMVPIDPRPPTGA
ncbi:MAG: amidase family protein [Alphaproteobacteria bacterium]|jgi:amidase|nr:amidase family protein [Alphaproteobacteria bacterium]